MKKILCLIGLYVFMNPAFSQGKISIIPEPVEIKTGEGYFSLNPSSSISLSSNDAELNRLGEYASAALSKATGFKLPVRAGGIMTQNMGNILFQLNKDIDPVITEEGYRMKISQGLITISANKPAGLYYGFQSLLQLLPKEIDKKETVANVNWQVPLQR